jgi:hypothetical protein
MDSNTKLVIDYASSITPITTEAAELTIEVAVLTIDAAMLAIDSIIFCRTLWP